MEPKDVGVIEQAVLELCDASALDSNAEFSKMCRTILDQNRDPYDYIQCLRRPLLDELPITDVIALKSNDARPDGYQMAVQLNPGPSLFVKRDADLKFPPITAFAIIFPDRKEFVPPGFEVVNLGNVTQLHSKSSIPVQLKPANLNEGIGPEQIQLCIRRGPGNPIFEIKALTIGTEGGDYFTCVSNSPFGHLATLRQPPPSTPIPTQPTRASTVAPAPILLLWYRQQLASLDPLIQQECSGASWEIWASTSAPSLALFKTPLQKLGGQIRTDTCNPPSSTRSVFSSPRSQSAATEWYDSNTSFISFESIMMESDAEAYLGQDILIQPVGSSALTTAPDAIPAKLPLSAAISSMINLPSPFSNGIGRQPSTRWSSLPEATSLDWSTQKNKMGLHLLLSAVYVRHGTLAKAALAQIFILLCTSDILASGDLEDSMSKGGASMLEDTAEIDVNTSDSTSPLDLAVAAICDHAEQMVESNFDDALKCLLATISNFCHYLSSGALFRIVGTYFLVGQYIAFKSGDFIQSIMFKPDDASVVGLKTVIEKVMQSYDANHTMGTPLPPSRAKEVPPSPKGPQFKMSPSGSPQPKPSIRLKNKSEGQIDVDSILDDDVLAHPLFGLKKTLTFQLNMGDTEMDNQTSQDVCHSLVEEIVERAMDKSRLRKLVEAAVSSLQVSQNRIPDAFSELKFRAEATNLSRVIGSLSPNQNFNDIQAAASSKQNACFLIAMFCHQGTQRLRLIGQKFPRGPYLQKCRAIKSLTKMLDAAGDSFNLDEDIGFLIRRVVTVCLLSNQMLAVQDDSIMQHVLELASVLWKKYRRHLKVEISKICNDIFFLILRQAYTNEKVTEKACVVLQELITWLDVPRYLVEMYLNYDMDQSHTSPKLVLEMMKLVCSLAEGPDTEARMKNGLTSTVAYVNLSSEQSWKSDTETKLQLKALQIVSQVVKSLMDMSGHGQALGRDARMRAISLAKAGGWEEDDIFEDASLTENSRPNGEEGATEVEGEAAVLKRRAAQSFKYRQEVHRQSEEVLNKAFKVVGEKSLKKAIEFLVASSFMNNTPRDIANFLRVYRNQLDLEAIGDYISEGGLLSDGDHWDMIRQHFIGAISFHGMHIEEALRHFLTNCGFRLPGEGQKIDRMITTFAHCYYEDNMDTDGFFFETEDAVFLLAYAMVMLNTDLNNPNLKRKGQEMSQAAFMKNLRKSNGDKDYPQETLQSIYASIKMTPISMQQSTTKKSQQKSEEILSQVSNSVKQAEELLLSLSSSNFRFVSLGVDATLSLELVRHIFEDVWYPVHGVIKSTLNNICKTSSDLILACLTLLKHAISTTMFLDMKAAKMAFAAQIVEFYYFTKEDDRSGAVGKVDRDEHRKEQWWQAIERTSSREAWKHLPEVHALISELEFLVTECLSRNKLKKVAAKLANVNFTFSDCTFIREGDLIKHSTGGKQKTYRFLLFSDSLIYAHQTYTGDWKAHNKLSLAAMKIDEKKSSSTDFQISHPVKSFIVSAKTPELKRTWIRSIQQAKDGVHRQKSKRRKSKQEGSSRGLERSSRMVARLSSFSEATLRMAAVPLSRFTLTRIRQEKNLSFRLSKSPVMTLVREGTSLKKYSSEDVLLSPSYSKEELAQKFGVAIEISKSLLDDENDVYSESQKLELYGLFKQAKLGDAPPYDEPASVQYNESKDVSIKKWKAWNKNQGIPKSEAMIKFINFVGGMSSALDLDDITVDDLI